MIDQEFDASGIHYNSISQLREVKVCDIMSRPCITITEETSLVNAREMFENYNVRHLPVINKRSELCGIVSDRDVKEFLSPFLGGQLASERDLQVASLNVLAIMKRPVMSVYSEDKLEKVIDNFLKQKKIGCLPVVCEKNFPIGIVTLRNVLLLINELV